ncbi:hypothetical protein [Enterococcus sp. K18_3]|uniref:hypothetical protein n=1 Tax=Enterococcus sp. K18_3 TaxID=2718932 RepID=UPI001C8CE14E|nr:hypothetical protein [Enterococcus sp. K18_3]MBX9121564.1 hypothetical protein [Enterococcus sp. K18_3]
MDKKDVLETVEKVVLSQYINQIRSGKIAFANLATHFKNIVNHGVYFVFDQNDTLVYVGQSGGYGLSKKWGLKDRISQHQSSGNSGAQNLGVSIQTIKSSYSFSYIVLDTPDKILEMEKFFIGIFSRILQFNKHHKVKIFT